MAVAETAVSPQQNMNDLIPLVRHEVFAMIDRAPLADSTKEKYGRVVEAYLVTGRSLSNPEQLAEYAGSISPSSRAHLKAAVKLWAEAMMHQVKSGVTPETIGVAQAAVMRFEALQEAIHVEAPKGQKAHTWLSDKEVKRMIGMTPANTKGQRDKLALSLLAAAGLRREEAVGLQWTAVKLQPIRGKVRTVLQILGKGKKNRIVPVSDALAGLLDKWAGVTGREGFVLRSVRQKDKKWLVGDGLSAVGLFKIVAHYGQLIGRPELAPHDLRRTYAQIGHEAGVAIEQISMLLGHDSIETTRIYLNLTLDLAKTISDFVPIS